MAEELGRGAIPEFSKTAQQQLERYPWPGNVRELKNVVERAVYRTEGKYITTLCFDPFVNPYPAVVNPIGESKDTTARGLPAPVNNSELAYTGDGLPQNLQAAVEKVEVEWVNRALQAHYYNQRKAAESLGLSYHQFRGLYRKYKNRLEH
jgi:psp operon transcriptional activator